MVVDFRRTPPPYTPLITLNISQIPYHSQACSCLSEESMNLYFCPGVLPRIICRNLNSVGVDVTQRGMFLACGLHHV
ncbi:hypothetical protein CHARACLAT_025084 [Characodon lateralis]|uniref:Uncharacterized protein n=1 Tax=Characodon lateralis TaxID=208331 RepID=A0ABU7D0M8_9TELE|nr:hypothetical protein [Characodon lateralis]